MVGRALEGLRVLLADDDEDSLEALARLLEMNGAEVRCCHDGREARGAMAGFKPDLIISDLAMPGENGYELIAAIRQLPAQEGGLTPAIAFSSFTHARDTALEAGYQGFVGKPIDLKTLLATIITVARPPGS